MINTKERNVEIKRLYNCGVKQVIIAEMFGITKQRVWDIIKGRAWIGSTYKTFKRDRFRCCVCGKKFNDLLLHCHHKDCNPGNNDEENLSTVCKKCHPKLHVFLRESYPQA